MDDCFKIDLESYYKALEVITCEQIIKLFKDQERVCYIHLCKDRHFPTNKNYYYAEVRFADNTDKRYFLEEQDERKNWNILMNMIETEINDPHYFFQDHGFDCDFYCTYGKNRLYAPKSIARSRKDEFREMIDNELEEEFKRKL